MALAFVAASLFTAAPAYAADYTGTCANISQFNGQGNVTINDANCNLSNALTATGFIHINATGTVTTQALTSSGNEVTVTAAGAVQAGNIQSGSATNIVVTTSSGNLTTGSISAGGNVKIVASSGAITTGTVDSNVFGFSGNILITASSNVQTGSINTHGASKTGAVEINANTAGGNTLFTIGASTANGVSGSINTSNTTAGGTAQDFVIGGIQITNGNANSTGGITVLSASNLQVNATASRSGIIRLNAQKGTLTLPSGVLQTDGASGQGAGFIQLIANTLAVANDTKISASQDNTALGTSHGVDIAANTISFGGTITGLEIHADGKGAASNLQATAIIVPQAGMTFSSNGDFQNLLWTTNFPNGVFNTAGSLNFQGAAGAPLAITADGDHGIAIVSGYPVSFSGGTLAMHSRGATDHQVYISYNGSLTGITGLTFANTGAVSIDANGVSGAGGITQIIADKAQFNAPTHTISSNGPTTGNGDGGTVYISSSALTLKSTSKATITADAASAGTGNAVVSDFTTNDPKAIQFYPGNVNVNLGTGNGQYKFSAKGGKNGGNGGAVDIFSGGNITVKNNAAIVDVSALAGNSNGGKMRIAGAVSPFVTFTYGATQQNALKAIGKGSSGLGGYVEVNTYANSTPTQIFLVNTFIKVNGGTNLAESANDGQIKLNNILCQQRHMPTSVTFPTSYWNCTAPGSGNDLLFSPVLTFAAPTQTALAAGPVSYFLFENVNEASSYLGSPAIGAANSTSLGVSLTAAPRYSIVFHNAVIQGSYGPVDTAAFPGRREGSTRHETGHQVDTSDANPSQSAYFNNLVQQDFARFDAISTCSLWGSPVCIGGVVQSPYAGHQNHEILSGAVGSVGIPDYFLPSGTPWREWWAEEFAIAGGGGIDESNGSNGAVLDPWFRGYFQCTQQFVSWVYSNGHGGTGPTYTGGCTAPPFPVP